MLTKQTTSNLRYLRVKYLLPLDDYTKLSIFLSIIRNSIAIGDKFDIHDRWCSSIEFTNTRIECCSAAVELKGFNVLIPDVCLCDFVRTI